MKLTLKQHILKLRILLLILCGSATTLVIEVTSYKINDSTIAISAVMMCLSFIIIAIDSVNLLKKNS
jgi:hypothetical protein